MLNITRRPRETIIITCPDGTRLEVTVLTIQGASAMIGIAAPKTYTIDRYEIDQRKQKEAAGDITGRQESRGPYWRPRGGKQDSQEEEAGG